MFLPIRTDAPLRTTPYVNLALITVNVLMFVVPQLTGQDTTVNDLFVLNAPTGDASQLYRFVSYAFLHGSIPHLLGNMVFLYIFGNNVCDKMGGFAYLMFYIGGAVFAGVGHVVFEPNSVLGASGAVAAVTGAYLVLFPRSIITVIYFFLLIGFIEVPSLIFVTLFFVKDLVFSFVGADNVAYLAHTAGTLFGFSISLSLLWLGVLPRDQFDIAALIRRWNLRRQHRDAVAAGYNAFDYRGRTAQDTSRRGRRGAEAPPDRLQMQIQDVRAALSEAMSANDMAEATRQYQRLKALDPKQVLHRTAQRDIANQFFSDGRYPEAAEAYETYLSNYARANDQTEQVELMLGLIYGRYLHREDRAREYLSRAAGKLSPGRELDLVRAELARLSGSSASA